MVGGVEWEASVDHAASERLDCMNCVSAPDGGAVGNGCARGIRSCVSWMMAGTTGVRGLVILPATVLHPSSPSPPKRLNNALSTAVNPTVRMSPSRLA